MLTLGETGETKLYTIFATFLYLKLIKVKCLLKKFFLIKKFFPAKFMYSIGMQFYFLHAVCIVFPYPF